MFNTRIKWLSRGYRVSI